MTDTVREPATTGEPTSDATTASDPIADLAARAQEDVARLDTELAEISLLAQQAATEAQRHDGRRAQAAEKLEAASGGSASPKELAELGAQVVTLTRRASLMEAQVEVLEGKRKALARYRESIAEYAQVLGSAIGAAPRSGRRRAGGAGEKAEAVPDPAAASASSTTAGAGREPEAGAGRTRLVVAAQEDLRREIARAMHDGPAQSLTNIVLQVQIVDRLLTRDTEAARAEMKRLTAMVQSTLEATKSFIFDVRPMVLDDLGLVPTLRRAARDRGRQAGVPVDCESLGADRRLPMELETALFRMIDEALVAYLERRPDRVSIRLDWAESLEAAIASHALRASRLDETPTAAPTDGQGELPALAAMIEDRRAEGTEAARSVVRLPDAVWREIRDRAEAAGVAAELLEDGSTLRLSVPIAQG